jgi:hypothetical protein
MVLGYALINHGVDIDTESDSIDSRRTPSRVGKLGPRHEPVFRGWCGVG